MVLGHLHQVGERLTDDGVQGHQEGHGEEGPQAAAGGLHTLPLIELLQLDAVALPVPGILLLEHFLLIGQAVHGHHALPALQKDGEENQADDQTEENQRDRVAAGYVIKQQQQLRKRG